jgi:hypothetical protein
MKGLNFLGRRAYIKAAGVRWYVGDTFSVPKVYKGPLKVVAIYFATEPYLSCISMEELGTVKKEAMTSHTIARVNLEYYHNKGLLYSDKLEDEGW